MRVYTLAIHAVRGTFRSYDKRLDWVNRKEAKRANAHAHE
ncbi:MAG: hypothetical protein ACJA2U_002718 [Marinomonas primoryensis]|jgi:hypothetical protein